MKDFKQLEVWRLAQILALDIYGQTRSFPREERYGLTDQIRRAAVSIPANIAEECGRDGDADFARFVQMAFGSACELECHLLVARELGLICSSDHAAVETKLIRVKRMLASLLKGLRADR